MKNVDDAKSGPISLGPVLQDELAEIRKVRQSRNPEKSDYGHERKAVPAPGAPISGTDLSSRPEWQARDKEWVETIAQAHKANLVGLAFSGGGIRSATFNLGVLQALGELNLLSRIDYLSTVSGGGYIGGWLAAWAKRQGKFSEVQKQLATRRVNQKEDNEPAQIRFLRMFSNYLTPKLGIFSGDTCAAAAIILRNILLNQVVLLAVLITLLLLPRVAWHGGGVLQSAIANNELLLGGVVVLLLLVALLMIMVNMVYVDAKRRSRWTTPDRILCFAAGPLFASAILAALWPGARFQETSRAVVYGVATYGGIWVVATVLGLTAWGRQSKQKEKLERGKSAPATSAKSKGNTWTTWATIAVLVAAVPAGALGGWLCSWLSGLTMYWRVEQKLTFGVPLVLGIFLLVGTLHIGLMGTAFADRRREWWGRLGGWLLVWGISWLALFWVALYFPHFIYDLPPWLVTLAREYLTPAWIVTTVAGLFAAKSGTTGTTEGLNWKDWLAKAAPYIFVVGLVCWVSWGVDQVLGTFHSLYAALLISVVVALVMAWRVDINQFSMHQLYRNRLVRCYLGASNYRDRCPNRFTGLDETDDLALKDLNAQNGYDGPYPILNASLNLVKGQDLAWQERKAESFVMSPLYCGYDVWLEEQDSPITHQERLAQEERPLTGDRDEQSQSDAARDMLRRYLRMLDRYGYRPTESFAFPPPRGRGLFLGTAMGISGAAASPNMGCYTSTPVAFLMTVFNVRLGQWLGNPRHVRTWRRPSPKLGLTYLLNELLGRTNDDAAYVYLSDGGHFDNLGLYELVKRRCGLIIVCDAEADSDYTFSGLGSTIRKCRIDMGVDIQLDISEITPQKKGEPSRRHCAVGTIHYENTDLNAPTGTIIYFKASFTGDESTDIKNYKKAHDAFPHESTVDQWFSESQFECYRRLGHHEVLSSIRGPAPQGGQAVRPAWWSDAATAMSEAWGRLTGGPVHTEKPTTEAADLGKKLQDIFKEMAFDTLDPQETPGSASGPVPGR